MTEEKRRQMNDLYFAAIAFRRAQLDFCDGVNQRTLKNLMDFGDELGALLKEINGGKDPVCFISKTGAVCETAALIAGDRE